MGWALSNVGKAWSQRRVARGANQPRNVVDSMRSACMREDVWQNTSQYTCSKLPRRIGVFAPRHEPCGVLHNCRFVSFAPGQMLVGLRPDLHLRPRDRQLSGFLRTFLGRRNPPPQATRGSKRCLLPGAGEIGEENLRAPQLLSEQNPSTWLVDSLWTVTKGTGEWTRR